MVNLKWWFMFCSSIAAVGLCWLFGFVDMLRDMDVSRLGYVILAIYFGFSMFVGYLTFQASRGRSLIVMEHKDSCYYVTELLQALGMAGTIIGFMYMLHKLFGDLDMSGATPVTMEMLARAATGLSTACITTLVGIVCSYALRAQLVNLNYLVPENE